MNGREPGARAAAPRCAAAAVPFLLLSALRFAHLGAPLTTDEGFTLKRYAAEPLAAIVASYDAPNNHLLLSVLLHGIDALSPLKLFGTLASPWPLQLPSILSSIGALALLYAIAAILLNRRVAALAMTALGVSFWHLAYSHMLRGYSLSVFLNLLCVWLALQALVKGRLRWLLPLPAALAAAHYVIPTNAASSLALVIGSCLLLRERRSLWTRPLAAGAAAALAAGGLLTYLAYRPVLSQLLSYASASRTAGAASSSAASPVADVFRVLGSGWTYRIGFAAVAFYGLAFAFRRRGKWRAAASLAAAYIAAPPLLFAIMRAPPPARVYTGALPFWALAFAAGLYGAAAGLRRRLPPFSSDRLWLGLMLLLAGVSAGQISTFWNWNRGLDARGAIRTVASRVEHTDDFAVIATQMGDASDIGDNIDWEYYGYASAIYPYYNMVLGADFPYLIRGKYFILAEDEAAARVALARTNVDPFLAQSLRQTGSRGRVRVFELTLDDPVLASYRAALRDESSSPSSRAAALAGLGFDALHRERLEEAASLLEKAKVLSPDDEKIRYLLGWAYYVSFDDAKAGPELCWIAEHDSANVHAPLYCADTLAAGGRFPEALRWYAYYDGPNGGAAGYMFQDRAKAAAEAAGRGAAPRLNRSSSRARLESAAEYFRAGSYERAVSAFSQSLRPPPALEARANMIAIEMSLKKYAAAERDLRTALDAGAGDEFRLALAKELAAKQDFAGAKSAVAGILKANPGFKPAVDFSRDLNRL